MRLGDFAPWLLIAPAAAVAGLVALALATPVALIGLLALGVWKVTLPRGVREGAWGGE